jgi:hypothetical protein
MAYPYLSIKNLYICIEKQQVQFQLSARSNVQILFGYAFYFHRTLESQVTSCQQPINCQAHFLILDSKANPVNIADQSKTKFSSFKYIITNQC